VPKAKERRQLLDIARQLARADGRPDEHEKDMFEAVTEALAL
jgi:tellurite resistance protein